MVMRVGGAAVATIVVLYLIFSASFGTLGGPKSLIPSSGFSPSSGMSNMPGFSGPGRFPVYVRHRTPYSVSSGAADPSQSDASQSETPAGQGGSSSSGANSSDERFTSMINSPGPVMVYFTDYRSPDCVKMDPIALKVGMQPHVLAMPVNPTTHPELLKQYNVTVIPTTIFFKNGKETSRCEGVVGEEQLTAGVKGAQQ